MIWTSGTFLHTRHGCCFDLIALLKLCSFPPIPPIYASSIFGIAQVLVADTVVFYPIGIIPCVPLGGARVLVVRTRSCGANALTSSHATLFVRGWHGSVVALAAICTLLASCLCGRTRVEGPCKWSPQAVV